MKQELFFFESVRLKKKLFSKKKKQKNKIEEVTKEIEQTLSVDDDDEVHKATLYSYTDMETLIVVEI